MRKNIVSLPLVMFFCLNLLSSCGSSETDDSSSVPETEFYESYMAIYDANDQELRLTARYNRGGNNGNYIKLVDGAGVTVNSQVMKELDGSNSTMLALILPIPFLAFATVGSFYTYTEKKPSDVFKSNKFVLTLNSGKQRTRSLAIPKTINTTLPESGTKHSNKLDLEVPMTGSKLESNQSISCVLQNVSSTNDGKVKQSFVVTEKAVETDGKLACTFSKDKLSKFSAGQVKLVLKLTATTNIDKSDNGIGGKLYAEYQSKPIVFEMTE